MPSLGLAVAVPRMVVKHRTGACFCELFRYARDCLWSFVFCALTKCHIKAPKRRGLARITFLFGVSALPATAEVGDQVQGDATRRAIIGHHRQWLNCSMKRGNRFGRTWSERRDDR